MKNRAVAVVVGALVTIGLLTWVLRNVSLAEVLTSARQANWWYLAGAITLATTSFAIRVPRWKILLRDDDGRAIPPAQLWHAIAIGFMANNLIPFRAGEFLRALAISRLAKVRMSTALSSLVAERLFDGMCIVLLLFVGLLGSGIPSDAEIAGYPVTRIATRLALAPAIILAACLAALFFPATFKRIVRAVIPKASLAEKLCHFIDGIEAGLGALTSPGRVAGAAFWSLVHWLVNGLSFYLGFRAFGIPVGFGGALVLQSVVVVLIAAPSTPGYFGVFEAAIKAVLVVFGIAPTVAVAYALTYHITTFFPITALGFWSLSKTPIHLKGATQLAADVDHSRQ